MVKKCSNPGCGKNGDHQCSKCGSAQYCSRECQVGHFSIHSASCYQRTADNKILLDSLSIKQLKYMLKMKASSMSESAREALKEQEAGIVEKSPLIALVEQSLSQSDMKTYIAAYASEKSAPAQSSSAAKRTKKREDPQLEGFKRATPNQLRQQAEMFRKHPDDVRRSNPQLAHMSNAELLASAEQMEMFASDPAKMKEAIEQMERMTPEEREMAAKITPEQREAMNNMTEAQKEQIQKMNQLSPSERAHVTKFQTGLQGTIDDEWTNAVVGLLKNKGEALKLMARAMFNVADDQVDPWVDMLAGMDEWSVRLICRVLGILQAVGRPAAKAYEQVDKYTFGMARHLLMLVAGICLYYSAYFTWFVLKYVYQLILATFFAAQTSTAVGQTAQTAGIPAAAGGIPVDAAKKWAAENADGDFDF